MDRRFADRLVAGTVVALLGLGVVGWWSARTAGGMHVAMHGTGALRYLFGAAIAATVVAGFYALGRDELTEPPGPAGSGESGEPGETVGDADADTESDPIPSDPSKEGSSGPAGKKDLLSLLPEDERRILAPVLDSPGLTQIEVRDRSDFSKAKVSQTVTDLEKRGLLRRERQGRTYRIYPGHRLEDREPDG
jgi:DNA-binding transcriptional ArsR family regulator